jgi:transcriptional regulator with XRE-family HTH domain
MARLRLRELAEARGLNMSQVQRQSGLTMGMVRRYWYNEGKDGPLNEVQLEALDTLARLLGVQAGDLLESEDTQIPDNTQAAA